MKTLCKIFGHKSREDDRDGSEYMRVVPQEIDGMGVEHAELIATCPRCGDSYRAGRIRLPRARFGRTER